jgi:hypothetical protein
MSGDYKWDIQCIAEDIAQEAHGKEFYELSDGLQYMVYQKAAETYFNRMADRADYLRKAEREGK